MDISQKEIKIITLIMAIAPILDPYAIIGHLSIMNLVILCISFWILIRVSHTSIFIKFNKYLLILIIVLFITTLISLLGIDGTRHSFIAIKSLINWLLVFIIASFIWTYLDKDIFFKYVKNIAIFSATYLYIQFIMYTVFGIALDGKIPFLSLSEYNQWSPIIDVDGSIRVHSIFQEPSYVSIYFLPIMATAIAHKNYILFLYLAIATILTTSSIGIIGLVLITICYLIFTKQKVTNRLLIIICMISIHFICYKSIEAYEIVVDNAIDKISNIGNDLSDDRMGSSKIRIIGYLPYYFEYPSFYKLFGVGANQFPVYLSNYNVLAYSSTLVTMILDHGLIGLTALISTFILFLSNIRKDKYVFVLIFIAICSVDRFWFNWYFFYIITFIIMEFNKNSFIKLRLK